MSKVVKIDNVEYNVKFDEFIKIEHKEYNNLLILSDVRYVEKVVGLLRDVRENIFKESVCKLTIPNEDYDKYGSYIAKNLEKYFSSVHRNPNEEHKDILYSTSNKVDNTEYNFLLLKEEIHIPEHYIFKWTDMNLYLYVHTLVIDKFRQIYKYNIFENNFVYDNLIHLVVMVKDAGDDFKNVLEHNIPHIDRLTILDTGSTDNTVNIVKELLATKVRGELYEEPFINFRESRNRALDLAGDICKFTLMLDDTYCINGDLRGFLNEIRGDQFADSFSLYIQSDDVQYVSNRLVKTNRKLRYIFRIHEVIQEKNNKCVITPINRAYIFDKRSDYMENRTMNRKQLDLKLLFESVEEEPFNPRHLYYIAQTYNCIEQKEEAYKFFLHRAFHHEEGFFQEKIDALFEAGRIAHFTLKRPWEEVLYLYNKAFELDTTRPDTRYFIAIKHYLDGNMNEAFKYFKHSFELGYPIHSQYSLKPTLTFFYTPKFLVPMCYGFNDYKTGKDASILFLTNNKVGDKIGINDLCTPDIYNEILSWYHIYDKLLLLPEYKPVIIPEKPILCFVADGNFHPWTGRDILKKGMGGSETYIVEMARYIQKSGKFNVWVFCKCSHEESWEGVQYLDLSKYYSFIRENQIHTCIISRFSEYLPATYKSYVKNIHIVVHDLTTSGIVIPNEPKLKHVFLLSEWHKEYFDNIFSGLKNKTIPFHYGIDFQNFKKLSLNNKIKNSFIYSSFANRGLLPLLEMWSTIKSNISDATLHIYSDIDHQWTNQVAPDQIAKIKQLLDNLGAYGYKNKDKFAYNKSGIFYHGWVSKQELAKGWSKCEYWLYPCIFQETFCLTALEAALTKTLPITNHLAALKDTVGDRGVIVEGDPMTEQWKSTAVEKILWIIKNKKEKEVLLNKNYEWALTHSWENQANKLMDEYLLKY